MPGHNLLVRVVPQTDCRLGCRQFAENKKNHRIKQIGDFVWSWFIFILLENQNRYQGKARLLKWSATILSDTTAIRVFPSFFSAEAW